MNAALPLLESDLGACCTPTVYDAISVEDALQWAARFKAIGDPTRLRLLSLVAAHPDNEACVCDLTEDIGLSQGTISHHLKILVEAGFLKRSKRGTWSYYSVVAGSLESLTTVLHDRMSGQFMASSGEI